MRVYLLTVASVAALLIYGSPTHHTLTAVLLAGGALPLYVVIVADARRTIWATIVSRLEGRERPAEPDDDRPD